MDFPSTDKKEKTIFHGGMAYIERIHEVLKAINTTTAQRLSDTLPLKQNLWANYNILLALYKELSSEMEQEEKENHFNLRKQVRDMVLGASANLDKSNSCGFAVHDALDAWEIDLREFAKERGLIIIDREEDIGL